MRRALCGLGVFLHTACVTHAPDQVFRGGYSEIQLSPDVYEVRVASGVFFSPFLVSGLERDRFSDLVLLRAAELTLEQGSSHFIVEGGRARSSGIRWTRLRERASAVCRIRIFGMKPNISDPSISMYTAGEVQRELRRKLGVEPIP